MVQTDTPSLILAPPQAHQSTVAPALNSTEFAYSLAQLHQTASRIILVQTSDMQKAAQLAAELALFIPDAQREVEVFPDWETLPYDVFSADQSIVSRRLKCLATLPERESGILIVPASTSMQYLPPRAFLAHHVLMLKVGDRLDIDGLRLRLDAASYRHTAEVTEVGEYSVRGSIIDLYPAGLADPIRIELFDDEIESIRYFDANNQRSKNKTDHIELLPAREFPLTSEAISAFRQNFREMFDVDTSKSPLYQAISDGHPPGGIEYYLSLFFDELASFTDFLPKNTLWITDHGVTEAAEQHWHMCQQRYEARRYDRQRPILPPDHIYIPPSQWPQNLDSFAQITLSDTQPKPDKLGDFPDLTLQYKAQQPAQSLQTFLHEQCQDTQQSIAFIAESEGRREVLLETLHRFGIYPRTVDSFTALRHSSEQIHILVGQNNHGLWLKSEQLILIAEGQLHAAWVPQSRRQSKASKSPDSIIQDLTELNVGDPVVHEQQGIGRYGGLIHMAIGDTDGNEYALIEYANEAKLYVPVTNLHLISRYTGGGENPPLHKLGSEQWTKARRRAMEKASDTAAELLDIYARRQHTSGRAMELDESSYAQFANGFAFQETPDQAAAIANVIKDLCAEKPMDRLVCGDVGFGKTEVAMRAAFVAVHAGYQVAMLAPTTLLAQQHTKNFMDRFADWPVKVAELSRFRTAKEQKVLQEQLANGQVDIVIGTHKLLSQSIKYQQLGLVIIDEEHRFGVKHKEKLKSLRSEVDVLTLTATPIPRTLNLALSGMRELSIIATPPLGRQPIQTFVQPWQEATIQEAISRELNRGGQVYFLHNEVHSMERMHEQLKRIVPEAKISVAHGQMNERQLEQVMLDFYHQRSNILLCSTIIESGIDVPTANTMIINRADKLGLAQLHQLRGRVGRSSHRAYAYLLTPAEQRITPDAQKRLDAIESIDDLGAGYLLANHDMEIRGSGEILGDDQSGQIAEVGFSMYVDMLEQAIKAIERGDQPALEAPIDESREVDLGVPALIPSSYLPDVNARMTLYKRIGFCKTREALHELQVEMIDRFGLLPEPAQNLLLVTQLKLLTKAYGISKITANDKSARIVFDEQPNIDAGRLILLIQQENQRYQLDGQNVVKIKMPMKDAETRLMAIEKLLEKIKLTPSADAA